MNVQVKTEKTIDISLNEEVLKRLKQYAPNTFSDMEV